MTSPPTLSPRLKTSTSWSQSTTSRFFSLHATSRNLSSTTTDTSLNTLPYPSQPSRKTMASKTKTVHKKTIPPHSLTTQPSIARYFKIKTPNPHRPNTPLAPSKSSITSPYDHLPGIKLEPLFTSIEFQSPISRKNLDTPQALFKLSTATPCPPVHRTNLLEHLTTESSHAPPSLSSPSTTYIQRKITTYFYIVNRSNSSPLPGPLPSQDHISSSALRAQ
jgi:hypothetical protein